MRKSVDLHAVGRRISQEAARRSEGSRRDPPTSWSPSGSPCAPAQERQREGRRSNQRPGRRVRSDRPVPSGRAGATPAAARVSRASYGAAIRSNRRLNRRVARGVEHLGRQTVPGRARSFGSARRASRRGLSRNRRDRLARCRHPSERRASRRRPRRRREVDLRQGHLQPLDEALHGEAGFGIRALPIGPRTSANRGGLPSSSAASARLVLQSRLCSSASSRPLMASATKAASATVRAIRPGWSSMVDCFRIPVRGKMPRLGL